MADSVDVNIIPKSVDTAVQNIVDSPSKEIGQTITDLIYLVTNPIHFAANKKRAEYEHGLEAFKKGLDSKLDEIPPQNLVEPKLQVVGPAIEDAKYCVESETIRELFENLIARASDSRFQTKVHPSFSQIIKQLSPLDAENLQCFKPNCKYPIVEYQLKSQKNGSYVTVQTNIFLENPNIKDDFNQQALSLASLEQLGLITIRYDEWITNDSVYNPFEKTSYYIDLQEQVQRKKRMLGIVLNLPDIQKGVVYLTPLGSSFYEVCIKSPSLQ